MTPTEPTDVTPWDISAWAQEDAEWADAPDVFASAPLTDFDPCGDER